MAEFTAAANLDVRVADGSLSTARQEIESELGDIEVGVGASTNAPTGGGSRRLGQRSRRRQLDVSTSIRELGETRNEILLDILDELEGGAGGGGGGGGTLRRRRPGGGGGGLGGVGGLLATGGLMAALLATQAGGGNRNIDPTEIIDGAVDAPTLIDGTVTAASLIDTDSQLQMNTLVDLSSTLPAASLVTGTVAASSIIDTSGGEGTGDGGQQSTQTPTPRPAPGPATLPFIFQTEEQFEQGLLNNPTDSVRQTNAAPSPERLQEQNILDMASTPQQREMLLSRRGSLASSGTSTPPSNTTTSVGTIVPTAQATQIATKLGIPEAAVQRLARNNQLQQRITQAGLAGQAVSNLPTPSPEQALTVGAGVGVGASAPSVARAMQNIGGRAGSFGATLAGVPAAALVQARQTLGIEGLGPGAFAGDGGGGGGDTNVNVTVRQNVQLDGNSGSGGRDRSDFEDRVRELEREFGRITENKFRPGGR